MQRRQRRSRPRGAAAAQDQDLQELEVTLGSLRLTEVSLTALKLGNLLSQAPMGHSV